MATVKQCIEKFREFAPEEYTYDYDNVGLIVGSFDAKVSLIMCCLDVTDEVLDEATEMKADLIISHHPMLFSPIKRVVDDEVIGKKIIKAIKNDINIYAAHTNLDFVTDGINEYSAKLLDLDMLEPLDPYINSESGFGRVGSLRSPMTCEELRRRAIDAYGDPFVRIIGDEKHKVSKVAVINGAGGGDTAYIDMALKKGAECLVTADVKHHVGVYALDKRLTIIEPQHYTMEYCYVKEIVRIMKEKMSSDPTVEIIQSRSERTFRK